MLDSVTIFVILVIIALWVWSSRGRRRASKGQGPEMSAGVKQGPIPGYSMLPGELIRWDPNNQPPGLNESWTTERMETLHAGRRTR